MTWDKFIKPGKIDVRYTDTLFREGLFVIEPLERGYGMTIGNSLRRVLMSSIPGSAITAVKIEGIIHEFSTIPGVAEDVAEIILNLKACRVSLTGSAPKKAKISVKGPKVVLAQDIEGSSDIKILDPNHEICTVSEGSFINMELTIDNGIGYVPAISQKEGNLPIGVISIDALYSPVLMVNYNVEQTRVGQRTDYDKLILTIKTDGSLRPEEALSKAGIILKDHFDLLIDDFDRHSASVKDETENAEVSTINRDLLKSIDELALSARPTNCLKNEGIFYIGDLVRKNVSDLLQTPNLGRKSINEIQSVLESMGLSFGMEIPGWPQDYVSELTKRQNPSNKHSFEKSTMIGRDFNNFED